MHFTVFFVLGYLVLCCVSTFQQGIWPHLGPSGRKYSVSLPYVRFPLPPSWAGEILIPGKNDELFFWLFAAESSSSSKNLISE